MGELKRIPVKVTVSDFRIIFDYYTWKGKHRKTGERKIKHFDLEEARRYFKEWAKNNRVMSNVQILDITEIPESSQVIEL